MFFLIEQFLDFFSVLSAYPSFMEQNYTKKKNLVNGPRPIVIARIIAFSKYYKLDKGAPVSTKNPTDD